MTSLRAPSLDAALAAFRSAARAVQRPAVVEELAVSDALGRVLAAGLVALRSSPPVRCAAMDGVAVRAADLAGATAAAPVELPAGAFAEADTGGPVAERFDAVLPEERLRRMDGGRVLALAAVAPGASIRPAGEDLATGAEVLGAGRRIGPVEIGIALSSGTRRSSCRGGPAS